MDHHVLPQVFTLGDLTGLIVNKLGVQVGTHGWRAWLVQVVVVLESLLVCQLCVDLDPGWPSLNSTCYFLLIVTHSLFLFLCSSLFPYIEKLCDIGHAMISIEECGHRIEEILVLLQVLLPSDILKLKDFSDIDILKSWVLFQITHQLLQEHQLV
jgi:hypothetical protein